MPAKHAIVSVQRLCVSVHSDDLTIQNMQDSTKAIREHPDFRPWFDQLIYLCSECDLRITTAEMQAFSVEQPIFAPTSRRVILMEARDPVLFGAARMFQQLRSDAGTIRLCHELDDAAAFLALSTETLQNVVTSARNEP